MFEPIPYSITIQYKSHSFESKDMAGEVETLHSLIEDEFYEFE